MHMLFDLYEVALLLGSCFLVNSVTADAKTNWAEGLVLVGLYVMIACASWFYPGQPSARWMLRCVSVLIDDAKEEGAESGGEFGSEGGGEGAGSAEGEAAALVAKLAIKAARRAFSA
jgi:hypothetical protein